jgi:DNA-binding transcriptional ArsR family regulator
MKEKEQPMRETEARKRWVEVFSALASEPRLRIVEMLIGRTVDCQEILDELALSQPAVSYHLGRLERAGVLVKERNGARNCYHLNKDLTGLIELLKEEVR